MLEQLAVRVRAELEEMPGMQLTLPQAQRLWGLDPATCASVIDLLVAQSVVRVHQGRVALARDMRRS